MSWWLVPLLLLALLGVAGSLWNLVLLWRNRGPRFPAFGCAYGVHPRALRGGGAHFGDDLLTCYDCGEEWYEGSSLRHHALRVRQRTKGPDGRYIPVDDEDWEQAAEPEWEE